MDKALEMDHLDAEGSNTDISDPQGLAASGRWNVQRRAVEPWRKTHNVWRSVDCPHVSDSRPDFRALEVKVHRDLCISARQYICEFKCYVEKVVNIIAMIPTM